MPRPFTPLQARENERFLAILARTGNARLAARETGRAHSSFQHRRKTHSEFDRQWRRRRRRRMRASISPGGSGDRSLPRGGPATRFEPKAASRWWCAPETAGCR